VRKARPFPYLPVFGIGLPFFPSKGELAATPELPETVQWGGVTLGLPGAGIAGAHEKEVSCNDSQTV
jgi:hypothetical protein